MENKFGTFRYFINGVVSSLKSKQQERQLQHERRLQLEREKAEKVVYLKPKKQSSWFREKIIQKLFENKKVREEQQMKKSVSEKTVQIGEKRFWKGKQDYVHTG